MKIKRSRLLEMLQDFVEVDSAQVLLESIVEFCKAIPASEWRVIFDDELGRKKFLDHYVRVRQASVDCVPSFNVVKIAAKANAYFDVPKFRNFCMALVAKLYDPLTLGADNLGSIFGLETADRVQVALKDHPILLEPLHENVLLPSKFTKEEQLKIGFLKKAVDYIQVATTASRDIFTDEIVETAHVLKNSLQEMYDT